MVKYIVFSELFLAIILHLSFLCFALTSLLDVLPASAGITFYKYLLMIGITYHVLKNSNINNTKKQSIIYQYVRSHLMRIEGYSRYISKLE